MVVVLNICTSGAFTRNHRLYCPAFLLIINTKPILIIECHPDEIIDVRRSRTGLRILILSDSSAASVRASAVPLQAHKVPYRDRARV